MWPISVDLPASTCPTTTKFSKGFAPVRSLAYSLATSGRLSRVRLENVWKPEIKKRRRETSY